MKAKTLKRNLSSIDNKENLSDDDMFHSGDEYRPEIKKIKVSDHKTGSNKVANKTKVTTEKCSICLQEVTEKTIKLYTGHLKDAQEECVTLTDPKLIYFSGDEIFVDLEENRPTTRITHYRVYCKNGHLVSLESGILEKNIELYLSGYVKPVFDDNPFSIDGIPTYDIGPINCWNIAGFDGGSEAYITIETTYAEYILSNRPHEDYEPMMRPLFEKMFLCKYVIEFLLEEDNPTYEDLMNKLNLVVPPLGIDKFTEDTLMTHSQFLCDHVASYDQSGDPDEPLLIVAPCMTSLLELTGVAVKKKVKRANNEIKTKKVSWTKATTTELVRKLFENFFTDQIKYFEQKSDKIKLPRGQRCGQCEVCMQEDCGQCNACKDKKKFGGSDLLKKSCLRRKCPNIAVKDAYNEEDEFDNFELENVQPDIPNLNIPEFTQRSKVNISWIGKPVESTDNKIYYEGALIGNVKYRKNDYVLVQTQNSKLLRVAQITYMYESGGKKMFHGNWFRKGIETILGETADPKELFQVDECSDIPLTAAVSKTTVQRLTIPENWTELGNTGDFKKVDGNHSFFYHLHYNPQHARFEDAAPDLLNMSFLNKDQFCEICDLKEQEKKSEKPNVLNELESTEEATYYSSIKYRNVEYQIGDTVYLIPGSLKFEYHLSDVYQSEQVEETEYDEEVYPEKYRKRGLIKGSNDDTPDPFEVGYINQIYVKSKNWMSPSEIYINVNKFFRPHNTKNGSNRTLQQDLHLVYWSDEACNIPFDNVTDKCYVKYIENLADSIDKIQSWSTAGPDRFYFSNAYDAKNNILIDPPQHACEIGHPKSNKNANNKLKSKGFATHMKMASKALDLPKLKRKLRTLDVFAGCGGLSSGLHDANLVDTRWAVEFDAAAANAYKLNFPETTVFHEDCNQLLQLVIDGEKTNDKGQTLPQKGDVELLCGGPPCQGFSNMNRFNSRQYSLFKNSLVASYLSYCDYYRPRYFIMENVRNFVTFKSGMVMKMTLSCLVRMGYQCTIGIMQAGNYGVPQTRRRMIILAAAPGEKLPKYPEPLHAFSKRATKLGFVVDNKKYISNCKWTESAPYRSITVRDAMCDLPSITNGCNNEEMLYEEEPLTHFQRMARSNNSEKLRDHICKDMSNLVEARMKHIPTTPGADWRDLPNIEVVLKNNTKSNKLIYKYGRADKKGDKENARKRGVCRCAENKSCNPADRQDNTLIPWCLPHTANRHNNWAGLYGRLQWDGFFSTTVTNPEPMGKQGRVLHPKDNRVVSVRECARSQGFKDSFIFYGHILEKHRQIGNAVPPPLAKAIGCEILKCAHLKEVFDFA